MRSDPRPAPLPSFQRKTLAFENQRLLKPTPIEQKQKQRPEDGVRGGGGTAPKPGCPEKKPAGSSASTSHQARPWGNSLLPAPLLSRPPFPAPAGGPWGWRLLLPEGDPRSSGKFPLLPSLGWGPRAGVCWPHYIPAPKPLALLQAVSGGFWESEKAPFLLWALQPSAGSLRRGGGWGETPFPPVYWMRLIQLNGNRTQSPRLPQPNESRESFPDLQMR